MSYFMAHYPQMTEYDILSKDWDWVDFHRNAIQKRVSEERRFSLMALMVSCAAAFNGGEAMDNWNQMFEDLMTPEEAAVMKEAEEQRLREQEEAAREEKIREWRERKAQEEAEREKQEGEQQQRRGTLLSSF